MEWMLWRFPRISPLPVWDQEDAVYMTKKEKYHALWRPVKEAHEKGQPVLVGTITIEVSELLSNLLKRAGIQHNCAER